MVFIGDTCTREDKVQCHYLLSSGQWRTFNPESSFDDSLLDAQYRYFVPMDKFYNTKHFYIEQVYEIEHKKDLLSKLSTYRLHEDNAPDSKDPNGSPFPLQRIACMSQQIKESAKTMILNLLKIIEIRAKVKVRKLSCILLFSNATSESSGKSYNTGYLHHVKDVEFTAATIRLKGETSSLLSSDSLCHKTNASIVTDATFRSRSFYCSGDFCKYIEEEEVQFDDFGMGSIQLEVAKARGRCRKPDPDSSGSISAEQIMNVSDTSAPFAMLNSRAEYRKQFEGMDAPKAEVAIALKIPFKYIACTRIEMGDILSKIDFRTDTLSDLSESISWPSRLVSWFCKTGRTTVTLTDPTRLQERNDIESAIDEESLCESSLEGSSLTGSQCIVSGNSITNKVTILSRKDKEDLPGAFGRYYSNVRVCRRCYNVYRELEDRRKFRRAEITKEQEKRAMVALKAKPRVELSNTQKHLMARLSQTSVKPSKEDVDDRFGDNSHRKSLMQFTGRLESLQAPLPWKLSEEKSRHAYERAGSRFVVGLGARAQEETLLAEQYSKLMHIQDRNAIIKGTSALNYLDGVKEDHWPEKRRTENGNAKQSQRLVHGRGKAVITKQTSSADPDQFLHPWQRELKALLNSVNPKSVEAAEESTAGTKKQMVRKANSLGSQTQSKSGGSRKAGATKGRQRVGGGESAVGVDDDEEDESSFVGWSPFIIPSLDA